MTWQCQAHPAGAKAIIVQVIVFAALGCIRWHGASAAPVQIVREQLTKSSTARMLLLDGHCVPHPTQKHSVPACVSGSGQERQLAASIQRSRRSASASGDRQRRARLSAVSYASRPAQDPTVARRDSAAKTRADEGSQPAQPSVQQQHSAELLSSTATAPPAPAEGSRSWDDGDTRPSQQRAGRPALRDAFSRPSQPARTGGQRPGSGARRGSDSQEAAQSSSATDSGGTSSTGTVASSGNGAAAGSSGPGSFSAQARMNDIFLLHCWAHARL